MITAQTLLSYGFEVYQEEEESSFTHDGKTYLLNPILKRAHELPVKQMRMKELAWVLEHGEADPVRVASANTSIPLLVVLWEGKYVTIDGFHRLTKAAQQNLWSVPVKIIPRSWLTKPLDL